MVVRSSLVWLLALCLGCQSVSLMAGNDNTSHAKDLWVQGQQCMQEGRTNEAIHCYEQSLAAAPTLTENHLSLAAAHLEKGDVSGTLPHLAHYVAGHPENLAIRAHYAELLLQLHHLSDARIQFEELIVRGQDQPEWAAKHLIHCHRRLMEVAEEEENSYDEHLHRGIGLYLLAEQRAELPDPEGDLSSEALLCRAAAELKAAHLRRPREARPCWYLSQAWSRLDQQQPALRYLQKANTFAPFSYLTPIEQQELQLAYEGRTALALARK